MSSFWLTEILIWIGMLTLLHVTRLLMHRRTLRRQLLDCADVTIQMLQAGEQDDDTSSTVVTQMWITSTWPAYWLCVRAIRGEYVQAWSGWTWRKNATLPDVVQKKKRVL